MVFQKEDFKSNWDVIGSSFPKGRFSIPRGSRSPDTRVGVSDFQVFDKYSPNYDFTLHVEHLIRNIAKCGQWYSFKFFCKKCESENHENKNIPLSTEHVEAWCGIRYCAKPGCITDRYSKIYTQLKNNARIQGLSKMLHFSIGFGKINLDKFDVKRLRFERVIHAFVKRLKAVGVNIQAFKVLDISKGRRGGSWDGRYFVHYHFVAIPFKSGNNFYEVVQRERMLMMAKQKTKVPFHVQIFGLKKKESLLSYISLRSVGLYKPFEFKKDVKFQPKMLREQIENGEFMLLKDMFGIEAYTRLFFGRRFFSVVGGLPYGSKVSDNVSEFMPDSCPVHGKLCRCDIKLVIEPEGVPEPPPGEGVGLVCRPVLVVGDVHG